jgi:ADP-ribose pyrophosphatase
MLEFERLSQRLVFEGHRVRVYEDELRTPDGGILHYDLVKNRNGAGILLVDRDGSMIFVKQYRTTLDMVDIEIPAGCQEFPEEDFAACALREAEEETGLIPEKLYYVTNMIAAVGLLDERTAIYIGTDLKQGKVSYDAEEYIDVVRMSLEEALEAVYKQRIIDSKTIIAILAYKDMKERGIITA